MLITSYIHGDAEILKLEIGGNANTSFPQIPQTHTYVSVILYDRPGCLVPPWQKFSKGQILHVDAADTSTC